MILPHWNGERWVPAHAPRHDEFTERALGYSLDCWACGPGHGHWSARRTLVGRVVRWARTLSGYGPYSFGNGADTAWKVEVRERPCCGRRDWTRTERTVFSTANGARAAERAALGAT